MTIKIRSTELRSDVLMSQDESGVEQPAGQGEAFSITIRGRASLRSEVIAFLMMACELAEDGVISSEASLPEGETAKPEAVPTNDNAAPPAERAKRSYTRRQPKAAPPSSSVEPELPSIPLQAAPAVETPAPVASPSPTATAPSVPKTGAAPLRSREADVPAPSLDAPTPEELAAYEAANPFTETTPSTPAAAMAHPPKASPAPAPTAAPSPTATASGSFTLPAAARESKDIRGLLFAIAKELGETTDGAGAPVNEPTAAQMLAYAEANREALAKECALFKSGFNFDRVKNGIDAIYA